MMVLGCPGARAHAKGRDKTCSMMRCSRYVRDQACREMPALLIFRVLELRKR